MYYQCFACIKITHSTSYFGSLFNEVYFRQIVISFYISKQTAENLSKQQLYCGGIISQWMIVVLSQIFMIFLEYIEDCNCLKL
jgi:hypothetical protein